jgi:RNA polymerase sigma-70 factor (ECF subfamily)
MSEQMDSSNLVERCKSGDDLAWEALVRQYQSRIYGIAYTYVGNVEDARDLAQDIFVQIYRKLDSCREPDRFLPWIIRIARNSSVDFIRRRKARPQRTGTPAEEMPHLRSSAPGPDELSELASQKRLVYRALQKLSDISREIILLRDMQGLPLAEIAELLHVPLGTIKSRSNRARIELAQAVLSVQGKTDAEALE